MYKMFTRKANCFSLFLITFLIDSLILIEFVQCQNGQISVSRDRDPFNPFGGIQRDRDPFTTNPFTPLPPRDRGEFGQRDFGQRDFNRQGGVSGDPFNPFNPQRGINTLGGGGTFNNRLDFDNVYNFQSPEMKTCPPGWELYELFCYRFVRSPIHNRDDARRNCQVLRYKLTRIFSRSVHKFELYFIVRLTGMEQIFLASIL